MTDVMTVGSPGNPLPGPRLPSQPFRNGGSGTGVFVDIVDHWPAGVWVDPAKVQPTTLRFPSPILEEPMYFPGAAWKGTSGMDQRAYV